MKVMSKNDKNKSTVAYVNELITASSNMTMLKTMNGVICAP